MDAIWIVYNDFGPKHRKNQKMLTQRPKNHDIVHFFGGRNDIALRELYSYCLGAKKPYFSKSVSE